MRVVGIICEYNPFHKGHLYHLKKIREMFPDAIIVLVLGGYFLERGDISLISKWNKVDIAIKYGVDLVLELPCLYNTNSSDFFAYHAIRILTSAKVDTIVFGSELDDINILKSAADKQQDLDFNTKVRKNLSDGYSYPNSLSESLGMTFNSNDLLGISYIKAIKELNANIEPVTIKRTNDFLDIKSNDEIISAQNIREKIKKGIDVDNNLPSYDRSLINKIDENKLFEFIRYRIITERSLERFLGVDEGLENKLKKDILKVHNLDELILSLKSKRYTYLRIKRMLMHILLGIEKSDMSIEEENIRILGFSKEGQKYLKTIDNDHLVYKYDSRVNDIEKNAALIYFFLTNDESIKDEFLNKPKMH